MDESVLVTLAILNVNWDEAGISYIHNYVPFVADCLKRLEGEVVSVLDLQQALLDDYGLRLPQPALQSIVNRAAKDGLLRKQNNVLIPVRAELEKYDLSTKRSALLRQHEALIDKFCNFCESEMDYAMARDSAEETLLSFIEERSLPVLKAAIRGLGAPDPEMLDSGRGEYLVSSFIAMTFERDPEAFDYVLSIVKGSMLATALYLPNATGKKMNSLVIYLDTPFLLRALGWHDDPSRSAAEELMALLRSLGARLGCFTHTIEEIRNVLLASMRTLASGRRPGERPSGSSIVQHCLRNGIGPSELDRRAEKLQADLERMGVRVLDAPSYRIETTIDEKLLDQTLQDHIGYVSAEARLCDLKSLTAIVHLRDGKAYRELELSRAIFTTPNASLVRASRHFFSEHPSGDRVPVCALDHELATVAWLKSPVGSPDLPRKQVLADVSAAMSPDDKLWRRYVDEVDRLAADSEISEDDYYVLRFTVEARRALMRETMGEEHEFTSGTIADVLRRAEEHKQAELMAQVRALRAEVDASKSAEVQARADEAVAQNSAQTIDAKSAAKREALARQYAHRAANILGAVLVVAVVVAAILALPSPFPNWFEGAGGVVVLVIGALFLGVAILSVLNLWMGTSVRGLAARFEASLASRILRWLEHHLAVGADDA